MKYIIQITRGTLRVIVLRTVVITILVLFYSAGWIESDVLEKMIPLILA
jgi:hypothetical protein